MASWTFVVIDEEEEEHDTITKIIGAFSYASPGEIKQVLVGTICAVNGKACDLTGKTLQVLDGDVIIAQSTLQSWDETNQCYLTSFTVTVPMVKAQYTWQGNFPRQ